MIHVITWLWKNTRYRSQFTAEHVNALARMVGRHYAAPHQILCVTNHPAGIDPAITIIPDSEDFANVPSPHGAGNPSCYRRLKLFHPDAAQWFGERFVSLDLDCVITADMRPVWDRADDFVGWQDPMHPRQMNGSMLLLTAGVRPKVWTEFRPDSPRAARAAGFKGSDQAWISHCLPNESTWTAVDGVLSYRADCKAGLPGGARVVFFHGRVKPWDADAPAWTREAVCAAQSHHNPGASMGADRVRHSAHARDL